MGAAYCLLLFAIIFQKSRCFIVTSVGVIRAMIALETLPFSGTHVVVILRLSSFNSVLAIE